MTSSSSPRPASTGPANDTSDNFRPAMADAAAMTRAQMRAQARAPRSRLNRRAVGLVFRVIDLTALGLFSAVALQGMGEGGLAGVSGAHVLTMLGFVAFTAWLMSAMDLYRVDPRLPSPFRVARAIIAAGLGGVSAIFFARTLHVVPLNPITDFALVSVAALTLLHTVYASFISHWGRAGRLATSVVLIGATPNARKLIASNSGSRAVNLVGVFDDRRARAPSQLAGIPYLGDTDDLFKWSHLPEVDKIVLTVSPKAEERVQHLLGKLRALPQPVCLLLDIDGFDPSATSLEDIVGVQAARMSGDEQRLGHLIAKRLQDIVIGSVLFAAALPVMLLIGLAIRLDSRGPALFRQEREGFNGRMITVLKFRSMRHETRPETGKAVRQVELNDPRVTRLGKFLRKTSLDELPQFWNVLTGDMSLVGPRPHAPSMKTGGIETAKLVAEYAHRHRVKPGITGWAQVNGSRGPLHTPESARERIRWDLDYIAKANFWFDLWIMLRTGPALLGDRINIR